MGAQQKMAAMGEDAVCVKAQSSRKFSVCDIAALKVTGGRRGKQGQGHLGSCNLHILWNWQGKKVLLSSSQS